MGDNVAFQSAHGSFLTQSGNTLHCRATEIGPEQIFQVEKSLYTIDTKPKRKPVLSVAFGDYIRLKHIKTGQVLHSHDLEYKTGSLRHQVTCFDGRDENDWWQIESAKNETGYVKYGSTIKLRHEATGRRLYTVVGYQSPSTDQQEVCCYNTDDGNDRWKVVGGTGALEANNTLQLTHIASDVRLHSHKNTFKIFGEGLSKQQEVTAFGGHDDNDHWTICEIRGRCKME
jgi:dolichyl-phosphate-mannose--protein O-mannosyl transferase